MLETRIISMERAAELYLRLVPSLARKIEEETTSCSTIAERALVSQQVAWAALSEAAERAKMKPYAYAQALLAWIAHEKGVSYWKAATIACNREKAMDVPL